MKKLENVYTISFYTVIVLTALLYVCETIQITLPLAITFPAAVLVLIAIPTLLVLAFLLKSKKKNPA